MPEVRSTVTMCFKSLSILLFVFYVGYGETKKVTIMKCCPENEYVGRFRVCHNTGASYNFDDMIIYDKNIVKTGKKVKDVFELVDSSTRNFSRDEAFDLSARYNNYLMEDGTVMMELPNTFNRWTHYDTDLFCIDIVLPNGKNILRPQARIWAIPPAQEDSPESDTVIILVELLVSSVFMMLVLVVYSLLPELRNLCGMILMAYVASMLGAFLMLMTLYLFMFAGEHTDLVCLGFSFAIYFCFLSSFCWMNVMSIDIWWTFSALNMICLPGEAAWSVLVVPDHFAPWAWYLNVFQDNTYGGYAKARPIHRRGEKFKFAMYCLYAWGLPLAMTVGMGLVDQMDLTDMPWFIKPDMLGSGCFLEGGGKFVYLYVPMLIIIVMNWVLFLMTAFNIWRLSRGTAVLDSPAAGNPSAHRTHRHRFMVYLKLSVIMGVSWVLEVISALWPKYRVWYLTDAYNLLVGVSIFLIFVCKKKIIKKLEKRLTSERTKWSPMSKSRSTSVSSDSDTSQYTAPVCSMPSGSTTTYYK